MKNGRMNSAALLPVRMPSVFPRLLLLYLRNILLCFRTQLLRDQLQCQEW